MKLDKNINYSIFIIFNNSIYLHYNRFIFRKWQSMQEAENVSEEDINEVDEN